MTAVYFSPCLDAKPRALSDVRRGIAIRRLELLMEHRAALDTADRCRRELDAIERRLEMIESAAAVCMELS